MKKNKKIILPNECSLGRWIAALTVGLLIGIVLMSPLSGVMVEKEQELASMDIFGIPVVELLNLGSFVFLFCGVVLAIRWIAKTSLRDFVLGVGGKVDKKQCLTFFGLHCLGLALSCLIAIRNISIRSIDFGTFAALVLFMLLLTWTQTTFEELVFRGFFLRWACKNKLGYTARSIAALVVSSLIFGAVHLSNPEISSMTGAELLLGFFTYVLPGVMFYWASVHFGSLLPGIVLHWTNNFLLFILFSAENSALAFPTVFIDGNEQTAVYLLVSTAVAYIPSAAYILWDLHKKKVAAASA